MKIRAVAFDVDGTLYPNFMMYLRSVPFFFRNSKLVVHYGKVRSKLRKVRPVHDFYNLQARLLAESMNTSVGDAKTLVEDQIYGEWENILRNIRPYKGIKDVLAFLREKECKLAVLSDFPVTKKLELLQLENLWDYESSSEHTGYLKPNPEPFMDLSEKLNIPSSQILYVGNNYDYDVVGAVRAGMPAAHLSRCRRKGSEALFTFASYTGFVKKLQEENLV